MAEIAFTCPHCGHSLKGTEDMEGTTIACPSCKGAITLPKAVVVSKASAPAQAVDVTPAAAGAAPPAAGAVAARATAGASAAPPAAPAPEEEIFCIGPTKRAFLGSILLAILIALVGVAVAYAIGPERRASLSVHALWAILLAPAAIGLILLARVWVHIHSRQYRLTTQRFFMTHGLIAKHVEEIELYRVADVTVHQGFVQRLLGYGSITVLSDDESNPKSELIGVAAPLALKEQIRTAFRAARQREGTRATEFMQS